MMRAIKNYWAFCRLGYRVIIFAVVPAVLLLIGGCCICSEIPLMILFFAGYIYLVPMDIMSDNWFLSGFYMKNNSSLEYLQTSNRFQTMIRDAVIMDTLRRLLLYVGPYVLLYFFVMDKPDQLVWYEVCATMPFLGFLAGQVGVFVARHFCGWSYTYGVASVAMILMLAAWYGLTIIAAYVPWLAIALPIVAGVAAGVGVVAYSMKKVRDSYYDK